MKLWKPWFVTFTVVATLGVLCLGLLMWRGFRATTKPSAFEIVVARTVRNLAIPWHARNQKNPMEATPETLQDAREL